MSGLTAVSREELVSRARNLADGIRERAGKAEQDRVVPSETYQEFKDAGLLRAFVPAAYGGYALDFSTVIETSREIARVCGSSGWCLAIGTLHNGMVAGLPLAAQSDVFGPSEGNSVVCGVFMPGGTATVVEGGYRLTGTWDFASGCDHASHALLAAAIRPGPEEKPVGIGNMLLRRDEFSIEDNWHVAGLAGTGSRRVRVEDVFVAQEFSNSGPGVFFEEHAASESSKRDGGFKGLPGNSVATLGLAGVPIGIAQGALEFFRERLAGKVRKATFRGPQDQVAAQLRLAESAAEVDAVELMVLRDCEEMERTLTEGRAASLEQRGRYRRDAAYAFQTCAGAVSRLLPASGAQSIFRESPLQRAVRDTQVMATHVVADWDMARESYAKALLELPIQDPVF